MGKEWWENKELVLDDKKSLLNKLGGVVIANPDRGLVKNNMLLVGPVLMRMKTSHPLKTPYLDQFYKELWMYHALVETKGKFDPENPLMKLSVDDSTLHCDASGLKKLVGYVRREYLRPHVPKDLRFSFCSCFFGSPSPLISSYQRGDQEANLVLGVEIQHTTI